MKLRSRSFGAVMVVLGSAGCMRVDTTNIRVRDVHAIGVVGDKDNRWLLPPSGPPQTVPVYRNIAMTASLTRADSGAIDYTSEHWALGTRLDTTSLVSGQGHVGSIRTPAASRRLEDSVRRGGEVRLRSIDHVVATGPFGLCNGTQFGSCTEPPAVSLSLATDSRNIEEIDVVRTTIPTLGVFEAVFGAVLSTAAVGVGAVLLPSHDEETRNVGVGVCAGVLVLGSLILGNGLWRALTPPQRFVYRATN
jgi:hypothetical protein